MPSVFTPPKKIVIQSDSNELVFQNIIKPIGSGNKFNVYKYSKSKTKKGELLGLTDEEVAKLISTQEAIKK